MPKITDSSTGNFKWVLYEYSLGYGFKIFYGKKVKANLIGQSYVYYNNKEDAVEAMHNQLHLLMGINRDLLDLDKL